MPHINGKYLGQDPAFNTPEVFAPGIISNAFDERMLFFFSDGNECFYQIRGVPHSVVLYIKNTQDGWIKPETAFFSGKYFEEFGISQDGNTLVFTSNRPLSNTGKAQKDFYIWKSTRVNGQWSEPYCLGENLKGAGYPTIANNGNIYFFDERPGGFGKGDIYLSRYVNGKYQVAENQGDSVNTPGYDVDPFFAPNESYLIYVSNNNKGGLYISRKRSDGSWSKSVYMGDDISLGESICPSVSSDGKYLFFTSNRNGSNDIFWVEINRFENNK